MFAHRTTRRRSAQLVADENAAPQPQPQSRTAAKRKHAATANTDSSASAAARREEEIAMVLDAYERTLVDKAREVKALAAEMRGMTVSDQPPAKPQPHASASRQSASPLAARDLNVQQNSSGKRSSLGGATPTPTPSKRRSSLTSSTLSPRTLHVPSPLAPQSQSPPQPTAVAEPLPSPPAALDNESALGVLAPTPALAPPVESSNRLIDGRHALPAPYVTINPDLLRDAAWNFRDLQLLCMRLKLGGRGTRAQLVERLLTWHRRSFRKREEGELSDDEEDDDPLSIRKRLKNASNFSLLQLDTGAMLASSAAMPSPPPPPAPAQAAPCTPPLSPENEGHANGPLPSVTVAASLPQLLTPLLYRTARKVDGTPRSILSPSVRPKSAKRLAFSVFNGVKLIPSRQVSNEEMNAHTPSPTKQLRMDDEEEEEQAPVESAEQTVSAQEDAVSQSQSQSQPVLSVNTDAPIRPSFLSSVSSAIFSALSPRKSPTPSPSYSLSAAPLPSFASLGGGSSTTFTFDRLPSIDQEADSDAMDSDLSMDYSV